MFTTDFKYSAREQELIAYFGYTNLMLHVAPHSLYRMMAEKAFLENDRTLCRHFTTKLSACI